MGNSNQAATHISLLKRWLPALSWLRAYERGWLRGDVVAGVTLAAYLLPAGLGDASLANLPPEAGLYACLFGGLVFWLFCSSRHTTVTVTSAAASGRLQSSRNPSLSRTARYSGMNRPACRINHTGVNAVGSRRHAARNAGDDTPLRYAKGWGEATGAWMPAQGWWGSPPEEWARPVWAP